VVRRGAARVIFRAASRLAAPHFVVGGAIKIMTPD
jgi:hypothetical protein